MNIDFATLYLISVPGFLIGVMTGRLIRSRHWSMIREKMGILGRCLGGLAFLAYLTGSLVTLAIMIIYIANLSSSSPAINYWLTFLLASWIAFNFGLELWDLAGRRRSTKTEG